MPRLADAAAENFCLNVVFGQMSQADAYKAIGYSGESSHASRYKSKPMVTKRLAELRANQENALLEEFERGKADAEQLSEDVLGRLARAEMSMAFFECIGNFFFVNRDAERPAENGKPLNEMTRERGPLVLGSIAHEVNLLRREGIIGTDWVTDESIEKGVRAIIGPHMD